MLVTIIRLSPTSKITAYSVFWQILAWVKYWLVVTVQRSMFNIWSNIVHAFAKGADTSQPVNKFHMETDRQFDMQTTVPYWNLPWSRSETQTPWRHNWSKNFLLEKDLIHTCTWPTCTVFLSKPGTLAASAQPAILSDLQIGIIHLWGLPRVLYFPAKTAGFLNGRIMMGTLVWGGQGRQGNWARADQVPNNKYPIYTYMYPI